MKIVQVVGARPQFVKLGPVAREFEARRARGDDLDDLVLHTGQHYDDGMSDVFFRQLSLPPPAANLAVGSGGQGEQTARMLERIEAYLLQVGPDAVVVYGDTNSTIAGALAAVKLGIPVAHVEAGLRSFNRSMPEELNRVATDHLSDRLLAPTPVAMENLTREGLEGRSVLVGDVMLDAVLGAALRARLESTVIADLGLEELEFGFATVHRAENTRPERLSAILGMLASSAERLAIPFVFAVHPRTQLQLQKSDLGSTLHRAIKFIEPLSYLDTLRMLMSARLTLTDSGGLQKEAFCLGTPCITLRDETEWLETVEAGANILVAADQRRLTAALDLMQSSDRSSREVLISKARKVYGEGMASSRVVDEILVMVAARR